MYTVLYMASKRTQIYLTDEQRRQIDTIRAREGKSLATVVREALDAHLAHSGDIEATLDATFGSMPDLEAPGRAEWDRFDPDGARSRRG